MICMVLYFMLFDIVKLKNSPVTWRVYLFGKTLFFRNTPLAFPLLSSLVGLRDHLAGLFDSENTLISRIWIDFKPVGLRDHLNNYNTRMI
jgi:hypothetical protein